MMYFQKSTTVLQILGNFIQLFFAVESSSLTSCIAFTLPISSYVTSQKKEKNTVETLVRLPPFVL